MLPWVVAVVGLVALVGAVRLRRPHHRIAVGVAAIALALLFLPIECATAEASDSGSSTSCTSAVGLRHSNESGTWMVVGGLALLLVVSAVARRRTRLSGGTR